MMKTRSTVFSYSFFLTVILTRGVTSAIFNGDNDEHLSSDQDTQQSDEDSWWLHSQESNYDDSDSNIDSDNYTVSERDLNSTENKNEKIHSHNQDVKNNYYNDNLNEKNTQNDNDNQCSGIDEFNNQPEQSILSLRSEESEELPSHQYKESVYRSPLSPGFGRSVVDKVTALEKIVSRQRRRCGRGLLDLRNPLPVKNTVVKVSRHDFVRFQDATLGGLQSGRLEHLSVDNGRGRVRVECSFAELGADGAFKTNSPQSRGRRGRFAVHMNRVRGDVVARFHAGGTPVAGSVRSESTAARVAAAEDRQDAVAAAAAVVDESVEKKYRGVLERAVSRELFESTHRGTVARLKAEVQTPLASEPFGATDWTEDGLSVWIGDVIAGDRSGRRDESPRMGSVSYARGDGDGTYEMRFEVEFAEPRWTGDLNATLDGQRAPLQARAVDFGADSVRVRVTVVRPESGGRGCREIDANVRVRGLRYDLNRLRQRDDVPFAVGAAVERQLPRFVERSFGAFVKHSLWRTICDDTVVRSRPTSA